MTSEYTKIIKDYQNIVNSTLDVTEGKILIIDNDDQNKLDHLINLALEKNPDFVLTSLKSKIEHKKVLKVEDYSQLIENVLLNLHKEYKQLNYFGITGTNGKTTSAFYLSELIKEKTIFIGTLNQKKLFKFTKEKNLTTPKLFNLVKLLSNQKRVIENVILEMSSHALEQNRIDGVKFAVSGFTNLSQDHLDYHNTMEEYFLAKSKLFNADKSDKFLFMDNIYGNKINQMYNNSGFSVGISNKNDVQLLKSDKKNIKFRIENKTFESQSNVSGPESYNNLLLSLGMAYFSELFSFDKIVKNIPNVSNPPGRFEEIKTEKGIVVIDYSHSPDSIHKVITYSQKKYNKKIIVVFGAGGERDKSKRKYMGEAANQADKIILTNDNPRSEDPNTIINEIISGINLNKKVEVITNRFEAIKQSISLLDKEHVVLILGKGHENIQEINDRELVFNDKETVMKIIGEM